MKILIVDDEPNIRVMLQAMLQMAGHHTSTAADGEAALHLLRREPVDVIISDMVMPQMDGYRLCQIVRQDARLKDLPFIFHTFYTSPADAKLAHDVGADLFLHKPAGRDALQEALRRVTTLPRARPSPAAGVMPEADLLRAYSDRLVAKLELKNTELQTAHEKLRQVLAHSPTVLYTIKLGGERREPTVISDNIERLLGVTLAESGRLGWWLESLHPEDSARVLAANVQWLKGYCYSIEYRLRHKDGTYRWVEDSNRVVSDAVGQPKELVGVWTDITARHQTEQRMRQQAALLELTSDAIIVRDLSQRVTYWNKGATRLYGWTEKEATGQLAIDLDGSVPWEGRDAAHKQLMEQGNWQGELHQRTKDGRAIVVHSRWNLLQNEQGAPQAVLIINSDITEKQQLAAQFLRSQRMESIGMLAGGIAHDLNNAIAPILMSTELLKLTSKDPEKARILDTIHECAERGANMVKQIVTFARGSGGERGAVQPRHLIQEMTHLTRHSFPKDIRVCTAVAPNLWMLLGNPTQLHQILMNLCLNARDAMPKGGTLTLGASNVRLDAASAELSSDAKPGPYVRLAVTDTGTGITPEVRARLFEPFFTTKEPGTGTGLGLSTVHNIVQEHDGFLTVDSEVGRGTTFAVYLPAQPDAVPALAAAERPMLPTGNGELILVVDDEAAIRSIATQTLEAYGYRVVTASDGAQAVAVCVQHLASLQLLITDLDMPVMDGQAAIRAIRFLQPRLPIIAASGSCSFSDSPRLKEFDAQAFLRKPYSADGLVRTVHEVLQGTAP